MSREPEYCHTTCWAWLCRILVHITITINIKIEKETIEVASASETP